MGLFKIYFIVIYFIVCKKGVGNARKDGN